MWTLLLFSGLCLAQSVPKFDCPPLPRPPAATSASQLRPGNVDVIAAVGDSITAGFAMHSEPAWDLLDLVEYRGDQFMIGGNDGQPTIPNFLKVFNKKLVGASIGNSLPLDALKWKNHIIQPFDPKVAHLNGAQSQAKVDAVPAQIDYVIEQLKTTYAKEVNFESSWKVLNVLIGANNLCGACRNASYSRPEYFSERMSIVLDKVRNELPNTLVNLIPMFSFGQVAQVVKKSDYCVFMWRDILKTECGCLQGDSTDKDHREIDLRAHEFREVLRNLTATYNQQGPNPSFHVVWHPFTRDLTVPDDQFVSKLDCFHPSASANAALSVGLWNSMMGSNATNINPSNAKFICPNENTVLTGCVGAQNCD
jgi:hypothetical protein